MKGGRDVLFSDVFRMGCVRRIQFIHHARYLGVLFDYNGVREGYTTSDCFTGEVN